VGETSVTLTSPRPSNVLTSALVVKMVDVSIDLYNGRDGAPSPPVIVPTENCYYLKLHLIIFMGLAGVIIF
jgi:hypothetical protein